ncbi:uncharacterized protein IUM83_00248 [Phytophthora cinnamomi]|uniref:uncharacterized protein n=1 Tax=Phytophthora cinnamomi TaxID=4785 RepID=UPI003559D421|nr:hypothetical protein IUM83_00248 [Phytophthora cinnamomi]
MAFLQDEDAARAFEAALSFVDEYAFQDGEAHSYPDSSAMMTAESWQVMGPQPPDAADDKTQRRARANAKKRLLRKAGLYDDPNRARKERRLEMTFLQRKVEQLQLELEALQVQHPQRQRQRRQAADEQNRQRGALVVSRANPEVSSAWKEVACRQREQRDKAEKENVRLRLIIERQQKLAEALETLVQARIKQQMAEFSALPSPMLGRCFTGRTLDFKADINDFRGLLGELEKARREAMPFHARDTAEATWDHFKGMKKHGGNGKLYDKAAKSLDTPYTIIEDYAKELFANTARADVRVKQIVRRYVEADREIVILVASVSPVSIAHKPLAGLTFNYRCYALIKRAAAATEDHDLSLLQMCTLASLDDEVQTYDPAYMRALSNFVLGNTAGNIKADQELIENVLVQQVLNQRAQPGS